MKKKPRPASNRTKLRKLARKGVMPLDRLHEAEFSAGDVSVEISNYGPFSVRFRSTKEFERSDWQEITIPVGFVAELPHGFYVGETLCGPETPEANRASRFDVRYGKQKLKYTHFGFKFGKYEGLAELLTPREIPENVSHPEADMGRLDPSAPEIIPHPSHLQ